MKRPDLSRRSIRAVASRRPERGASSGFTLLEIILAIAIFLGALVVLGDLLATGGRAAVQSQLETEAILRCESKMAEVVAGVEPMDSVSSAPFADDSNWTWSLETGSGPLDDLLELKVSVVHNGASPLSSVSFSLTRLVRDPQVFLDALIEESTTSSEGG